MKYTLLIIGVCRNSQGSLDTNQLFTGQRLDQTGLYYYNARYYDATIGRFISPDTVVQDYKNPQSLNRYSYCLNNPLIYTDPTGYNWFSDWCTKSVPNWLHHHWVEVVVTLASVTTFGVGCGLGYWAYTTAISYGEEALTALHTGFEVAASFAAAAAAENAPLVFKALSASQSTEMYGGQTWTSIGNGQYVSYSGNTQTICYGEPNTVYDTIAALEDANPGSQWTVDSSGMIQPTAVEPDNSVPNGGTNALASQSTEMYGGQTWTSIGNGQYVSYSGNTQTICYGEPNTVYDTIAALEDANPGSQWTVDSSGMIHQVS